MHRRWLMCCLLLWSGTAAKRHRQRNRKAAPCLTHVVVAAAHYGDDASSHDLMHFLVAHHERALKTLMPRNTSAILFVGNVAPPTSEVLRAACANASLHYARNEDWPRWGFELGAWRWAAAHTLPNMGLCDDAIVYFTQDSLILNRPPLAYPPPHKFTAATIYWFHGNLSLSHSPRRMNQQQARERTALAAFATVRGAASPDEIRATKDDFHGSFGPNFAATWAVVRRLRDRKFFDMMRVETKLREQESERVVGLFLQIDADTRSDEALGGYYYDAERPKGQKARDALPFRKVLGSKIRQH